MISYAQNLEDVVLARALVEVESADGFWIDVGAADPVLDSVTKHFSDLGWRGVNVEPLPSRLARLRQHRTRDVNLGVVLGDRAGPTTLVQVHDADGLSSVDANRIAELRRESHVVTELDVEQVTLAEVCAAQAPSTIHFLKIDVEGHERAVIAGGDWSRYRPWIVVAEDTRSQEWEPLLGVAGYRRTLDDGLNLFFVAEERLATIGGRLAKPANVTDQYTPAREVALRDFALAYAAPTIAGELRARWAVVGERERAAADALATAVCGRPDVLAVFSAGGARPGAIDLDGLLRWATTDSTDQTIGELAPHRLALLAAQRRV